jgi:hypothetical protein
MSFSISEVENNLVGLTHSGTLDKVRNKYHMMERAANNVLSRIRPLETMRVATLASTIHDAQLDYGLPSDFNSLVGIYPQAGRTSNDKGQRVLAESFDRRQQIDDKKFSIEGRNGSKIIRINWNVKTPKTLHNMNGITSNGTWAAVATATNVATDTIYKYSGSGSIKFDVAASGDGIDNTDMSTVDLTSEDEIADVYVPFYIKDAADLANFTSIDMRWGTDLSANYWTGVTQTLQADGTAFRVGWNVVKFPWSTATETGTVDPALIDSVEITVNVGAAIEQLRVDNIMFSIGFPFDIKYYSKFLFQDSASAWKSQPDVGTDVVVLDNDAYNIFLYECLDEASHQMEGEDSSFDAAQASKKLWGDPRAQDSVGRVGLYAHYRTMYPSQGIKPTSHYGMKPRYNNSLRRY